MKPKKWIVWSDGEVEHTIREDCANARTICTMAMPLGPEDVERNRLHANSIVEAHNAHASDQKKIKDLLAALEQALTMIRGHHHPHILKLKAVLAQVKGE